MRGWTPSIVQADDQIVYLVMDDFGRHGCAWRETDVEKNDIETIIMDMLRGEYSNPVQIVGFNTFEGWARDVSEDVADELRHRCERHGISHRACQGASILTTVNNPNTRALEHGSQTEL